MMHFSIIIFQWFLLCQIGFLKNDASSIVGKNQKLIKKYTNYDVFDSNKYFEFDDQNITDYKKENVKFRFKRNTVLNSGTKSKQSNKRVTKQVKKQRPGFFWTLGKVVYETFNDTRSAIRQISNLVNDNFAPEPTTRSPGKGRYNSKPKPTTSATSTESSRLTDTAATGTTVVTSTQEPEFKLSRTEYQKLIMRNLKGLIQLFNIEWKDAMQESGKTVKQFRSDLGKQLSIYLKDNPDNY